MHRGIRTTSPWLWTAAEKLICLIPLVLPIGAYQSCPRQDLPSHARQSRPPKFQVPLKLRWYQVNTLYGLIFTFIMYALRPGHLEEIILIPAALIFPHLQWLSCRPRLHFRTTNSPTHNALRKINYLWKIILCFIVLNGYVVGSK